MYRVLITKQAQKTLKKVPSNIEREFLLWKAEVEADGLLVVRKNPSYHDEPLKGKLRGVRSVRLNLGYRIYYRIEEEYVFVVVVLEVNKHDYKKIQRGL